MSSSQQTTIMDSAPTPIPLRTLIVLLNYERTTSDPRFKDARLVRSSIAEPALLPDLRIWNTAYFTNKPKSIKNTNLHVFDKYSGKADDNDEKHPPTTCLIHPDATSRVKELSFEQKEVIYHESRGQSGCFKAGGLFQFFFELCPPNQKLEILVAGEEPVLVNPASRSIIKFIITFPLLQTHSLNIHDGPLVFSTGDTETQIHCVVVFPSPTSNKISDATIVDMARMQYGRAGKGVRGEYYFLGSMQEWSASMKAVCGSLLVNGSMPGVLPPTGSENERFLRGCAERAWKRWCARETEGWCEFCGRGGELKACAGCKETKVRYCCKEHQRAGWKVHKFTCEKA